MNDLLEIFVFGGLTIKRNGAAVGGLASRKAEALLVYLACTGRTQAREVLAELLWDDRSQAQALANLRVVLNSLRQALGPYLTISRLDISLNEDSPHWLDAAELEKALAVLQPPFGRKAALAPPELANVARALALYQGDFLDGFFLRDCQGFEEWQLVERERWRLQVIEAQYHLIAGYQAQGETMSAIQWARRLLQLDPLQEEGHRQLMRLLAITGQRPAALMQYELCREVLAAELGVEPGEETVALYHEIHSGDLTGSRPGPAQAASAEISSETLRPAVLPAPPRHNLPTPANSFVNRYEEVAQVIAYLNNPACRLLTLVGPGGIGKTRLAIEASRRIAASLASTSSEAGADGPGFPDGIYFVSLDSLNSAEFLVSTLANALRFSFYSGTDPTSQLLDFLREKNLLLVLDNLEHILAQMDLLVDILAQAPMVKILAVSRERLNLSEEYLLPVRGLLAPAAEKSPEVNPAPENQAALQLFLQRAQAVYPDFDPSGQDMADVARICRLLEGIPLAIELAAAWVRLLSCQEIAREIDQNLDFLVTSLRNVPQRHRSMRAVFDSSWQLLSDQERTLFRDLAVFNGGFERDAAERVTGASLPLLLALVDKSLLYRTETGRFLRHTLLYQYAVEKLAEAPQERAVVEARHCDYYLTFLQVREPLLKGGGQQAALAEISAEIENVRASWYWAIAQKQLGVITRAVDSLFHFYEMRSWFQEGAEVFGRAAMSLTGAGDDRLLGMLLARRGWFTFQLGQHEEAKVWLKHSLELLREVNGRGEIGFALNYLGAVHQHLGEFTLARQYLLESQSVCAEIGDQFGLSIALNVLSQVAYLQGDYAESRRLCQESLALKREIGDRRGMAFSLRNLGLVAYALQDYQAAQNFFQESLAICREMDDRRGIGLCLNLLGDVSRATASFQDARQLYQDSLSIFREIGNQWGLVSVQIRLGHAASVLGEYLVARSSFNRALKTAMDIQAVPIALEAVVGVASLLAKGEDKERERAVELLGLVLDHSAAPKSSRDSAARLLTELESRLPAGVVAAAVARGHTSLLEAVAKQVAEEKAG